MTPEIEKHIKNVRECENCHATMRTEPAWQHVGGMCGVHRRKSHAVMKSWVITRNTNGMIINPYYVDSATESETLATPHADPPKVVQPLTPEEVVREHIKRVQECADCHQATVSPRGGDVDDKCEEHISEYIYMSRKEKLAADVIESSGCVNIYYRNRVENPEHYLVYRKRREEEENMARHFPEVWNIATVGLIIDREPNPEWTERDKKLYIPHIAATQAGAEWRGRITKKDRFMFCGSFVIHHKYGPLVRVTRTREVGGCTTNE